MSDQDSAPRSGEEITLELDADIVGCFERHDDDLDHANNAALREHAERQRRGGP